MKRNKVAILVYLLIGFAIIGLFSQLFGNTINFLMRILMMLGIAAAIFAFFYFVVLRNRGGGHTDEMKKYKQAVKQSKVKYKQSHTRIESTKIKKNNTPLRKGRKRPSHLRVIEGNKSKDKDRATF